MDLVMLNHFFYYSTFSSPSLPPPPTTPPPPPPPHTHTHTHTYILSNGLNIAEFIPIKIISLIIVITSEKNTISGLSKQKGHSWILTVT